MEKSIERVNTLLESLPYIKEFNGKTIVIKYGGAAMIREDLKESFAKDIILLKYVGINPVIVHGGGPEINAMLKSLNIKSEFVNGHRVTTSEVMEVVEMVLTGKVNKQITSLINNHGGNAVGISGRDGKLAVAVKQNLELIGPAGEKEVFDAGLVGSIEKVNPEVLTTMIQSGFIPVISPVAENLEGQPLNINADTMAGAIAGSLKAEKLILLTDTEGILIDGKLATGLDKEKVRQYIQDGKISGGMIPKTECCLQAIDNGTKKTHIIDGRIPNSILIELFTNKGIGTLIDR